LPPFPTRRSSDLCLYRIKIYRSLLFVPLGNRLVTGYGQCKQLTFLKRTVPIMVSSTEFEKFQIGMLPLLVILHTAKQRKQQVLSHDIQIATQWIQETDRRFFFFQEIYFGQRVIEYLAVSISDQKIRNLIEQNFSIRFLRRI